MQMRTPATEAEWSAYYDLRWRVLRKPWGQPNGSEKDDLESLSRHLMIASDEGAPVAIGRLHFNSDTEAQIRFMAVEDGFRRQGLGSLVLQELEALAVTGGARAIVVNARDTAIGFYLKKGYAVEGDAPVLFEEVRHKRMRKDLPGNASIAPGGGEC